MKLKLEIWRKNIEFYHLLHKFELEKLIYNAVRRYTSYSNFQNELSKVDKYHIYVIYDYHSVIPSGVLQLPFFDANYPKFLVFCFYDEKTCDISCIQVYKLWLIRRIDW